MINTRDDVLRFMIAGDQTEYGFGSQSDLYLKLITEEVIHETLKGFDKNDIIEIADGIADSIWVIEGMAISLKLDLRDIWDDVNYMGQFYDVPLDKNVIVNTLIRDYVNVRESYRFSNEHFLKSPLVNLINGLVQLSKSYNIPLQEVWDEVARSNSSKISENGKVIKNENGKIMKPDTFSPANVRAILEKHNLV
jgi:predicted HAD superfamily Cof-like phosphohydrolase